MADERIYELPDLTEQITTGYYIEVDKFGHSKSEKILWEDFISRYVDSRFVETTQSTISVQNDVGIIPTIYRVEKRKLATFANYVMRFKAAFQFFGDDIIDPVFIFDNFTLVNDNYTGLELPCIREAVNADITTSFVNDNLTLMRVDGKLALKLHMTITGLPYLATISMRINVNFAI
jgi:hypothetical protein